MGNVPTCRNLFLEELSMSYVTVLGENSRTFVPGFPWILPSETFPFLDFALDPFTIINHSSEAVSPSSISSNLYVLRDPQHKKFYKMVKDKMDFYSYFLKEEPQIP